MLSPSRLGLNGPSSFAHNNGFRVRTAPYVCERRATHNTSAVSLLSCLPSVTSNLARVKPAVPVIPVFMYSFGLHLIAGAQGSGKTSTSIALMALFIKLSGGIGLIVDLENRKDIIFHDRGKGCNSCAADLGFSVTYLQRVHSLHISAGGFCLQRYKCKSKTLVS